MFNYTLDKKGTIKDNRGNELVDLAQNIFMKGTRGVSDYDIKRISKHFRMRPDLVSIAEYGSDQYAEIILKFAGVSNPFTIDEDDVFMIPNIEMVHGMMEVNNPGNDSQDVESVAESIRQYFKFVNQDYKSSSESYDKLDKMVIPSGVIDTTKPKDYLPPYISEDGRTALTVKGNRVYLGADSGLITADSVEKQEGALSSLIDEAIDSLSDTNCLYNGTQLVDFIRAQYQKNKGK